MSAADDAVRAAYAAEEAALAAYQAADAAHRAAFPAWDMTRELYRAGKRSDAEYLSARRGNDALVAAFDAASADYCRAMTARAEAVRTFRKGGRE